MLELAGVLPEILKLSSAGLFIVYLLWALSERGKEIAGVRKELSESQESRLRDLKAIVGEMQQALTQSTEVLRATNSAQAVAGQSAAGIATALGSFQTALGSFQATVERVEDRINELARKP